jgi:hypothetical protein
MSDFSALVGSRISDRPAQPPTEASAQSDSNWAQTVASARCWAQSGDAFFPVSEVVKELPSGAYRCKSSNQGPYLEKMPIEIDSLLTLPDSAVETLLTEFKKFWTLRENFSKRGFTFKRGLLMW